MGKRIVFLLFFTGTLSCLAASSLSAPDEYPSCSSFGIQRFQEKKAAHPFTLKMADGKQAALNDFRGKPLVFTFWASWCSACKEDIPLIEKLAQGKRDQLTIFTVAIDGENEKRVQRIIKESKINLPVFLDVKEKIARTYGIRMVPTTFLINPEGIMLGMIVGQRDWCSPEAWSAMKELFALR